MDCSIIIQTCDKYEKYWQGMYYYMDKFWDNSINCPIYFCNEEKNINNNKFIQIKTGKHSFVQNLENILNKINTKYIFYLLEDFWPINNFNKNLFENLFNFVESNCIKSLQVSAYTPYYTLEKTKFKINDQNLLIFSKESDWKFNLQSRFWEKDFLKSCLQEPEVSESKVNSAITVEVSCSNKLKFSNENIFFYHYLWYPFSGVSYRGDLTNFGKELENNMKADIFGKNFCL